jgi:predicted site-specific integrase-resolvase
MKNENTDEIWIDKQEIMMRLHISNRTLQTWRSKGIIPFTRIRKKIYYKESDLRNLLNARVRQKPNPIQSREQYGNSS